MTVQQFMDYCRPMYPAWDNTFAAKLMRQFELPPDVKLKACSRGMRMKAALLCSLAYRPRLVVLDEPFSGLDPLVRDEFIRGILGLTENEGWTVFVSSHDIAEVERMADRVAILNRGQLQLEESADTLQARFRTVEVVLSGGTESTARLPESWLNVEVAGRVLQLLTRVSMRANFTTPCQRISPTPSSLTPRQCRCAKSLWRWPALTGSTAWRISNRATGIMNLVLHQFRKDMRQFRITLAIWAGLLLLNLAVNFGWAGRVVYTPGHGSIRRRIPGRTCCPSSSISSWRCCRRWSC